MFLRAEELLVSVKGLRCHLSQAEKKSYKVGGIEILFTGTLNHKSTTMKITCNAPLNILSSVTLLKMFKGTLHVIFLCLHIKLLLIKANKQVSINRH